MGNYDEIWESYGKTVARYEYGETMKTILDNKRKAMGKLENLGEEMRKYGNGRNMESQKPSKHVRNSKEQVFIHLRYI